MRRATDNHSYGNIWVRTIEFKKKGDKKEGHRHKFDHLHFVSRGKVKITIIDKYNNKTVEVHSAPSWIPVPKEMYHDIVALEDNTVGHCIQALRDEDGQVMDTDYTNNANNLGVINKAIVTQCKMHS